MSNTMNQTLDPDPNLLELRAKIRHSAAHLLADAVMQLFPEAKLGIGPPTEDGFYYDLEISRPFTPDDLEKIEAIMIDTISKDLEFVYAEHSRSEIQNLCNKQPYKLELVDEIPEGESLTTYSHGNFTDLCQGPHVPSTGAIPAFKLLTVAGAYWRGDENRPMLQRIYGTAFETTDALEQHLSNLEEAEKRVHRRLGKDLELFLFDPLAPASPFFLPKGTVIYNLMLKFMRDLYERYGYKEVITPQIFSTELWKRSGHYDNYLENMYMIYADERELGVKPMNCPAACILFGTQLHSYRDLPVRYADFGRLHRYERSGVTHGLTRVRSFCQDDAHIFCRPEQVPEEVSSLMNMIQETYTAFGLGSPKITLSLRPEKRGGSEEMWDSSEDILRNALKNSTHSFEEIEGEGAFYGPKIDLFFRDAVGREWQLGTIQLDMFLPERFDLEYIDEHGMQQKPVIIHRAILGSIERFFGVLLEHSGGSLPLWLSPVQVIIIPIADRHIEYATEVQKQFVNKDFRIEIDSRNERMNLKIRQAQMKKIPYMIIVGDREKEAGLVSIRGREEGNLDSLSPENFIKLLRNKL